MTGLESGAMVHVLFYIIDFIELDFMDEYSFLADCLSTFRSVNDWIKALIVIAPFVFGLAALRMGLQSSISRATPVDREPVGSGFPATRYLEHHPALTTTRKSEAETDKSIAKNVSAWV